MAPVLGSKVNGKRATALLADLQSWLADGEEVRVMVRSSRVNPLIDHLVITDRRLLGVGSFDVTERGPKLVLGLDGVLSWQVRMTLIDPRRLCVTTATGQMSFGNLDRADLTLVDAALSAQAERTSLAS